MISFVMKDSTCDDISLGATSSDNKRSPPLLVAGHPRDGHLSIGLQHFQIFYQRGKCHRGDILEEHINLSRSISSLGAS